MHFKTSGILGPVPRMSAAPSNHRDNPKVPPEISTVSSWEPWLRCLLFQITEWNPQWLNKITLIASYNWSVQGTPASGKSSPRFKWLGWDFNSIISHARVGSTHPAFSANVLEASSWPKRAIANLHPRTKHLTGKGGKCWQSETTPGTGEEVFTCKPHDWLPGGSNGFPEETGGHMPAGEGMGVHTAALPSSCRVSLSRSRAWDSILTNPNKGFFLF